ncbi:hypothetical protein TNCV_2755431 [Trichonephila clavipes]|nr:hypothetical protein TNCV_2755431 [Trichonephila clavipes]
MRGLFVSNQSRNSEPRSNEENGTSANILLSYLPHHAKTELVPETDEIGNLMEEVVYLARQIHLEVDQDDVQRLLDSHNQDLAMDELIEMYEQEQDIDEDSSDPVQSED